MEVGLVELGFLLSLGLSGAAIRRQGVRIRKLEGEVDTFNRMLTDGDNLATRINDGITYVNSLQKVAEGAEAEVREATANVEKRLNEVDQACNKNLAELRDGINNIKKEADSQVGRVLGRIETEFKRSAKKMRATAGASYVIEKFVNSNPGFDSLRHTLETLSIPERKIELLFLILSRVATYIDLTDIKLFNSSDRLYVTVQHVKAFYLDPKADRVIWANLENDVAVHSNGVIPEGIFQKQISILQGQVSRMGN